MINNVSILFSIAIVVFVIVRAAMLDRQRPWFEATPDQGASPPAKALTIGRRNRPRSQRD